MNNKDCFSKEKFDLLKMYIIGHSTEIRLHERLISDKETISKELSFGDKYIELVEYLNSYKIIVIDKENKIPAYSCSIDHDDLQMTAYDSRFDTDEDIETRRNDWCKIITALTSKE